MYAACLPYQAVTWGKESAVCFLSQFLLPKTLGNCLFDRVFCPLPFLLGIKAQDAKQIHHLVHKYLISGDNKSSRCLLERFIAVMKEETAVTPASREHFSIPDFCLFWLVFQMPSVDFMECSSF